MAIEFLHCLSINYFTTRNILATYQFSWILISFKAKTYSEFVKPTTNHTL